MNLDVLNQVDLERASLWVDQNVENASIQAILNRSLEQSKSRVLYSQIHLGESDCAFVVRPWGNEIYISNTEEANESRLKIAVAVRAVAAEKEEPNLWDYLHDFEHIHLTTPKFEVLIGGKE